MIKWGKRFPVLLALAAVLTFSAIALSGVVATNAIDKEQRAAELLAQRSVSVSHPVSPEVQAKLALEAEEAAKIAAEETAHMDKGQDPVHIEKPGYDHSKDRTSGVAKLAGKAITYEPRSIFLMQDFEGAEFPPTGWDTINTDPGFGWYLGTAAAGGTQCALVHWDGPGFVQNEWLITPQIDPAGAGSLFRLEFEMLKGYAYPHDFKVYMSTTGTAMGDFTEIWSSDTVAYTDFVWFATTVDLSTFAGGAPFYLAFQYYGEDADLFGLDNVVVTDDAAPVGRCCLGDAQNPTCEDNLTQAECTALGGRWTQGLNCTDDPCPVAGPADNCSDVTPEALPFTFTGNNEAATYDDYCQYFGDYPNNWIAFTIPECSDITISFCGTQAGWQNLWLNLVTDCSCGTLISGATYDTDCANGNVNVYFARLDAGTYYYPVMLDVANGAVGDYSIDVSAEPCPPAPENDDCASAQEIGDVTDFAFSTASASLDGAGYSGGPNIWYCYTATCDGQATVSLCGSSYDTKLAAYDGCGCEPLGALLASNDDFCSLQSQVTFPCTAGNQYMIEVGSYSDGGDGLMSIECGVVIEQPGDNCADPIKVDIPALPWSDLNQTTCGRGNSYEDPDDAGCMSYYTNGEDIFYEITVATPVTVNVTLDPKGTTYAGMGLFSSCPPASDNCIAHVTSSSSDPKSMKCVSLDAGVYYLMVDTWSTPYCIPDFDLTIVDTTCAAIENDDCANAKEIGEVVDFPFNTDGASFDGPGGCMTSPNIWYAYTASESGNATISLCGSSYDTKLAVYEGTCGALVSLACNDDACSVQSEVEVPVTAGNTYYVEIGGYQSNTGDGILNIYVTPPCEFSCPSGATPEGEDCIADEGDDVTNGGCNSATPVFTPLACGETVCGQWNTYSFGGSDYRDTDWYILEVTEWSDVTLTGEGAFPIVFGFLEQLAPGVPGCDNLTGYIAPYIAADPCTESTVSATLAPGTYYVFVGGQVYTGFGCGTGPWEYAITATCTPAEPTYCDASGGCDESIGNVAIGSIDNASGCDGYMDFTALSTDVEPGGSYPITIDLTGGYSSDAGAVWVDWNHDYIFGDEEMVALDVSTGVGPYTGTVVVPNDASDGPARMRIRLTYNTTPAPCGADSYGEVEDYTLNVGQPAPEYVMAPEVFREFMKWAVDPMSGSVYLSSGAVGGDVNGMVVTGMDMDGCPVTVSGTEVIPGGYDVLTGDVMKVSFPLSQYITCVDGGQPLWDEVETVFHISYTMNGNPGQMTGHVLVTGHRSGDLNLDGEVNVGDVTFMVSYLFLGGTAPSVPAVGNVDGSANPTPNVSDLTYLVHYLFLGGPAPFHQ
jgi:predicted RNA-binding protein with TRAM domain